MSAYTAIETQQRSQQNYSAELHYVRFHKEAWIYFVTVIMKHPVGVKSVDLSFRSPTILQPILEWLTSDHTTR